MASRGINKAIIVGNLGNDPEMRYLPDGNAVVNISVATSETWNDKQTGQPQERTEWHRIVAYRKLAEIMGQYLRKGSQVYIEGRIQTRKWQDQNGQDRYSTEIIADQMQMLGSRQDSGGGSTAFNTPNRAQPSNQGNYSPQHSPQQQTAPTQGQSQEQPQGQPQEQFQGQSQGQSQGQQFKTPELDNGDDYGDDIPF